MGFLGLVRVGFDGLGWGVCWILDLSLAFSWLTDWLTDWIYGNTIASQVKARLKTAETEAEAKAGQFFKEIGTWLKEGKERKGILLCKRYGCRVTQEDGDDDDDDGGGSWRESTLKPTMRQCNFVRQCEASSPFRYHLIWSSFERGENGMESNLLFFFFYFEK